MRFHPYQAHPIKTDSGLSDSVQEAKKSFSEHDGLIDCCVQRQPKM